MLVIWSHGQEAGPWGAKSRSLQKAARDLGWEFEAPGFQGLEAEQRVEKLIGHAQNQPPGRSIVLAGSSMGGLISALAAPIIKPIGMFFTAPALFLPEDYGLPQPPPKMTMVHGWNDEIIPPRVSIEFAQKYTARLHLVEGDHGLNENVLEITEYFSRLLADINSEMK